MDCSKKVTLNSRPISLSGIWNTFEEISTMGLGASTENKQLKHDVRHFFELFWEFVPTITSIFTYSKWIGIPVYGRKGFLCLSILILLTLASIETTAIWTLIRAVSGYSTKNVDNRGVTARLSGAIFYGNTILSLILSWRLIKSWKHLSIYWLKIETKSRMLLKPDGTIKKRVTFVTSFVTVCACLEHILSIMSAIGFDCGPSEYLERYTLSSHGFILQPENYSLWVAVPIFIVSKVATALWNFQDLIVILISMGLASRYHRLNLFVKHFVALQRRTGNYKKSRRELFTNVLTWRRLREAYVQQADLVRKVDKELGILLLLCSLNNFYFICLQLFLGLRRGGGAVINVVYYFVSLGWMLFRACSVVLAAADVNFHSQRALPSVCSCPSAGYNIEVKRLKYQLINDDISLTAMGLFFMNRPKLLQVAASIVKYELILIQFDK